MIFGWCDCGSLLAAAFGQKSRIPLDPAAVEAGRQTYMGSCSGCHGATGEGSQGPSLLSGRASRLPDRDAVFDHERGAGNQHAEVSDGR